MRTQDISLVAVVRPERSGEGTNRRLLCCCAMIAASWLVAVLVSVQPSMAAPAVGAPAPDFVGTDSKGLSRALADYRGSTVVLEWTNHDCPYTVKHYQAGAMQALQKEATTGGGVWFSIISSAPGTQGHVSADEAEVLTHDRNAAPTAVILDEDGAIARLYDAKTTPHMFIIDGNGDLVYKGAIDDQPSARGDPAAAQNYVQLALGELAEGRPVTTASTQPYGCTIKYAD
jgi:peroxiredoxin